MKTNQEGIVAGLKASAASNEDFMRKLAQMETGEISPESQEKIDGGIYATSSVYRVPFIWGIIINIEKTLNLNTQY
ncbi:hypothetical protein [Dyadobacter sediminis]|uniref:Uncharacterized protein n=1 Tax=Dyadobacter sediminis TaxID=1493691 RepID=A0A5R9KJP6_9BACT|nr:hypothetical protein [Dyadobacter sediminis]TLU96440.1 hypothetical protein FEM55_04720 [Dyadobacter sediminis]GGB82240.1 hypothetical protein GCM10011325_07200 [Dyadobacter sediminis]